MDFKFSKDSGDSQQADANGEKKNQSALLVLLLILVGGFTYLYFFTGLIKPQDAQKTTEAPAPAPQAVKMPLPAREGEPDKPNGKTPEKAEAPKIAAATAVTAAVPAAKPAAAPTKPAEAQATKPAPAKPKVEPKKAEAAKAADKKPQPVPIADKKADKAPAAKAEVKKPVVDTKKTAVADKKTVPTKDNVKKPVSDVQLKPKTVLKIKKTATGSWLIVVGNYVLEEALSADMVRVRKVGFEPIIKPAARKKSNMNRLFVADFKDRASAQSTLEKLKRQTSDTFIMEQGGKFAVYAGSYLKNESALSEKERLKAAGLSVTVKHSAIEIPSQSLSIGPYNSKKTADAALVKLKGAGIKATLSQK